MPTVVAWPRLLDRTLRRLNIPGQVAIDVVLTVAQLRHMIPSVWLPDSNEDFCALPGVSMHFMDSAL